MKTKKPVNLKTWLIPKLRRLSYQWPARNEAKKLARRSRGVYECASCNKLFRSTEVFMDHVIPVVAITGFEDLGKYVEALFCDVNNYQALCAPCHDNKTQAENILRNNNKKS